MSGFKVGIVRLGRAAGKVGEHWDAARSPAFCNIDCSSEMATWKLYRILAFLNKDPGRPASSAGIFWISVPNWSVCEKMASLDTVQGFVGDIMSRVYVT